MTRELELLKTWLSEEMSKEEEHLRSIGGPTGMRNSQASAMGLARNGVREEVLAKITDITEIQLPEDQA